jgi:hypothetical protein
MHSMTRILVLVALAAGPGAALAQAGVVVGGAVARLPFPYGPVAPYAYGVYAPWGPCPAGRCADPASVRRYIAREIRFQELRSAAEAPAGGGFARPGESPFSAPRYLPPPTPDSEIQPRYQGSGDLLPEFREAGQAIVRPGG